MGNDNQNNNKQCNSKQCGTCKHWNKTTDYEFVTNLGTCSGITNKITIYIKGDAYIDEIQTEEDFNCGCWEK